METREFRYETAIVTVFTRDELELIKACCEHHYDATVKSIAQHGGFLYGWFNMITFDEKDGKDETEFTCRFRELDIIGKALEQRCGYAESKEQSQTRWNLRAKIIETLQSINEETQRLNDEAVLHQEGVKRVEAMLRNRTRRKHHD